VIEQAEHQNGEHQVARPQGRISRFGSTTDPVEAGRRGGKASAAQRRFREIRRIEDAILESGNGAAKVAVLRARMERDRALEAERTRADLLVCELLDEADRVKEEIAHHRGERNRLIEERNALLAEGDELRQAIDVLRKRLNTEAGLEAWLTELGEPRVTAAAQRIGWGDDDEDDA
jgi:DNA repair exonuclease SbcCD ATPase subunit